MARTVACGRMPLFDATDRRLLRLAFPAFLTLAAEPLYLLVDTAIVGHIGSAPLAGLAIAGSVLSALSWLMAFLAMGVTTQVAQRRGAGDGAGARDAVNQALGVAFGMGVAVAAFAQLAPTIARWSGSASDAWHEATIYLRVAAFGLPAIALSLLAIGWFRGNEQLRVPVRVAIAANVANVVLEMIFVWVFDWGIAGSAAATVMVQWLAVVAYWVPLRRIIVFRRPSRATVRSLFTVGAALIVRTGSIVATIASATWLASRHGEKSLAAHQIGAQMFLLLALIVDSLAISSQSVFAFELGRGRLADLRPVLRRLIRLGVLAGLMLALLLAAVSPWLGRLFSGDAAVVERSVGVLAWLAVLQLSGAVVFVLDGVLMGADLFRQLAVGAVTAAAAFWFANLAQATDVPVLSGLNGVWVALNVWMIVRLAGNSWLTRRYLLRSAG